MGHRADADLRASGIRSFGLDGIGFIVQSDGEQHDVRVNAIGRHMVYAALASIAVGQAFGMSLEEACETLRSVARPARLIATAGINGCTILDDTYNASPPSAMAALDALAELHGRRLAVLGDMLELGSYEAEGHAEVGRRAARTVDYLVTIGTRARTIARHAAQCGLQDDLIRSFSSPEDAVTHLSRVLGPQDSVLVKGSRALGLDRIVVALSHRA
jgi:UDP-N-acetylmuramoyl-tripeptide--D-alanyl-D-alanine ligase